MAAALLSGPVSGGLSFAPLRIGLTYLWQHGRWFDLDQPATFTELVQARKLCDHDSRMPMLADTARVKDFVARRIDRKWVIPNLWHGTALPVDPPWPRPFVVKSRLKHCGTRPSAGGSKSRSILALIDASGTKTVSDN